MTTRLIALALIFAPAGCHSRLVAPPDPAPKPVKIQVRTFILILKGTEDGSGLWACDLDNGEGLCAPYLSVCR